jgi:hypothetical protein
MSWQRKSRTQKALTVLAVTVLGTLLGGITISCLWMLTLITIEFPHIALPSLLGLALIVWATWYLLEKA